LLQFLSSFDDGNQSLAWEMEWATVEEERVSFCSGSGRSEHWEAEERRWGSAREIFIPPWGPTVVMGGTAALPITARFANSFDGYYGRV
jgi:hypothetical protein